MYEGTKSGFVLFGGPVIFFKRLFFVFIVNSLLVIEYVNWISTACL